MYEGKTKDEDREKRR